jgi:hypothetical protein
VGEPQIKFSKGLWNKKNGLGYYDARNSMLHDILENHEFSGKSISDLREFFGNAPNHSFNDSIVVQYNIITDFGRDIDPVNTKDLLFYLDSDSIVTSCVVVEDE